MGQGEACSWNNIDFRRTVGRTNAIREVALVLSSCVAENSHTRFNYARHSTCSGLTPKVRRLRVGLQGVAPRKSPNAKLEILGNVMGGREDSQYSEYPQEQ